MSRKQQAVAAAVLALGVYWIVRAGSLEPPGPPAATQRHTIYRVSLPLTISAAGSYLLAEDIDATDVAGITISADNVTIDLNGHALSGGTGAAIKSSGAVQGIEIRNGTIRNWSGVGIDLSSAAASTVFQIRTVGNGGYGIDLGDACVAQDSVAASNGSSGFNVGKKDCRILNCVARANSGRGIGVSALGGAIVNSTATANMLEGIAAVGASITGSTSSSNHGDGISGSDLRVTDSYVILNDGLGIVATNSIIRNNYVNQSVTIVTGIRVTNNCIVEHNYVSEHSVGIEATGISNRIIDNTIEEVVNGAGISVTGTKNIIARNTISGLSSSVALDIAAGNLAAPLQTTIADAGPWDNFNIDIP